MESNICKICGGTTIKKGSYLVCEYCGNMWQVNITKDLSAVQTANAWEALRDNDFEKATVLFEELIVLEPKNHEHFWGLALAKNEISFVIDLSEDKKVPTFSKIPSESQQKKQSENGVDVYENNINGVLEITWSDSKARYSGSGFLLNTEGYALTNTHVVTQENGLPCSEMDVKLCNRIVKAKVVKLGDSKAGHGSGIDLAVIKLSEVPNGAKPLRIGNFDDVKNGERIFVIGNSLGYGSCITSGIVSDRLREVEGKQLLMTDCAINGGNSGGPVFNEAGKVIGVVVAGITKAEGMNFAIPINDAEEFLHTNDILTQKATGYMPPRYHSCPRCGSQNRRAKGGVLICLDCGFEEPNGDIGRDSQMEQFASGSFESPSKKPKTDPQPANCPCPKCGSWNGNIQNGIFYCPDCGFEG